MELRASPLFLSTDPEAVRMAAEFTDFRHLMERHTDGLLTEIRATAGKALNKEPEELSEEEKFAIAYVAGVPMDQRLRIEDRGESKFRLRTVPCAITKRRGQWRVGYDVRCLNSGR